MVEVSYVRSESENSKLHRKGKSLTLKSEEGVSQNARGTVSNKRRNPLAQYVPSAKLKDITHRVDEL